jgi:hypothetical protein
MNRNVHVFLAVVTLGAGWLNIWRANAFKLRVAPSEVLRPVALAFFVLALAWYYRWRGVDKLKNLCVVAFWVLAVTNVATLPIFMVARRKGELQDALLAQMDHWIGLEVPDVLRAMEHFPHFKLLLDISYQCLLVMIFVALTVLVLCDKMDAVQEFFIACVVSVIISMPVFAAFQAVGPWHYYGYPADAEQQRTMQVFLALKTDRWIPFDPSVGLIAFPSFHTILAILCAVALWRIPYVRYFGILLACLIVISTVTTGWHYLVDVLAGQGIAAVSVATARGYTWFLDAPQPLPKRGP